MELKQVALNDIHVKLGAKMVSFAGYNMPVRYTSDIEEHMTVREAVGVFDVSHMGEFWLSGPQALDLIQYVCSNDASKLIDGQAQYSCLPNETGGIVDDLLIYRINATTYMLVVNASNIVKDWEWILNHNHFEVEMENQSDEMSLLAVQGPKATEAMQRLTEINLSEMKYYTFEVGEFAGAANVIVSATGYTGSGGFELYIRNEDAVSVWEQIFKAGADLGIKPIGLGARDTLRLEKGFCLYGNDIDDTTSPLEAGLGWITKFSKDFINSDSLANQKEAGVQKKLVGFEMLERGIPRKDYDIKNDQGQLIGRVTSGTQSPMLEKGIGMGYVDVAYAKPGTEIMIAVRKRDLKAAIKKMPLV